MIRVLAGMLAVLLMAPCHGQHGESASNMALLGHEELQGRSAYQTVIHPHASRWVAYIGHHGGKSLNPGTCTCSSSSADMDGKLAGRTARYITGAVIPVDGGLRRYQFS